MRCRPITLTMPDGSTPITGFVCGPDTRKRCKHCGEIAEIQCDWKLTGKKAGKTCDAWLCRRCARPVGDDKVGDDKDLCPPHAHAWDRHPKNPQRNTPIEEGRNGR